MRGWAIRTVASIASTSLVCACANEPDVFHPAKAPLRNEDVERWQRDATIVPTCPPPAVHDDRPCGLLADTLPPAEASTRLGDRYPFASIADMRGTCGLDPSCDLRAREMVWLESHNRNVARRTEETQARWAARRHDDPGSTRLVGFILGLGVGLAGVAIGASRGVR